MEKYIDEFDTLEKRMKKIKVQYPDLILALKLLHRFGISAIEKKLVLTAVDYSKENTLYDQMKNSLKKILAITKYISTIQQPLQLKVSLYCELVMAWPLDRRT